VRLSRLLSPALLVVGVALLADALARGGASVALVVVIPVFFGTSTEFFLGVAFLFVGIATLPLAFGYTWETGLPSDDEEHVRPETPPAEVGGLLLIGPLPIFFGRWKGAGRRAWIAAAVAGTVLLVIAVALFFWLR
jgi:uncharacterized membrane protein